MNLERVPGCIALVVVGLIACGGSSKPLPTASPAPETPALDDAGSPASSETDAASSAPTASASTPVATPPPAAPEPQDECLPIGVDFEKRARPKFKDCYRDGKKKDPNLEGTVRITVDVDTLGKVRSMKITDKTLPDPVAQCMLKAVKGTPFPEASKCPGKAITIPIAFPTPR